MNGHPIESISAYLDDELNADERRQLERHLATCETCRAMAADLTDIRMQVYMHYGAIEAPDGFERKVLSSLRSPSTVTLGEKAGFTMITLAALLTIGVFAALYGSTIIRLISIAFGFLVTVAYVVSRVASSEPLLWGASFAIAIGLIVVSGISIRRILRSTTQ